MLRMEHIEKIFRTDFIETHALSDFNLYVEKGEFLAVMGPSGAGKSTFLNIAGLLDDFDKGVYYLDDKDVSGLSTARGRPSATRRSALFFRVLT